MQALASILQIATPLLHNAALHHVQSVCVGAAGALANPPAARSLAQSLAAALPASRVAVTSDAITSHAGALGGRPGVVLAIGTGVAAICVNPAGIVTRADGWGPWLGDEGGGAWLGLQGLRAALRAHDGRGPATTLAAAATARFGPLASLPTLLERSANPARLAASFAPDLAAAAQAGDAIAAALMAEAVQALAATVRAAASAWPAQAPLAITGGLANHLILPLLAALPAFASVPAEGSSIDGAHRLATDRQTALEPTICRTHDASL